MQGWTDEQKISSLSAFPGVSAKYARNIWMDVDPAALSYSFALDSNLLRVIQALYAHVPRGVHPTKISKRRYNDAEAELVKIANAANLSCWETDRFMYGFNSELIAALRAAGC